MIEVIMGMIMGFALAEIIRRRPSIKIRIKRNKIHK